MQNPCEQKVNCPCADSLPLSGYSAEAPDVKTFTAMAYEQQPPPLGTDWKAVACAVVATSTISQADANLQAEANGKQCAVASWKNPVNGNPNPVTVPPVPPPQGPHGGGHFQGFFNAPQQGTALCPDGTTFSFQVPAGLFFGLSQLIADTEAITYAQRMAVVDMICLSSLSATSGVLSQPFHATVTATGRTLSCPNAVNSFYIVSGQLPPGLFLTESGSVATISGTPTATGTYPFTLEVIDSTGQSKTNAYSITITGVFAAMVWQNQLQPSAPPDSQTFNASGDTVNLSIDARVNGTSGDFIGLMNYAGGGFRGQLVVTVKQPWTMNNPGPATDNFNFTLFEGGGNLIAQTFMYTSNTPVGTYVFPFTVTPTAGSVLQLFGQAQAFASENFQMNVTFFIQQFAN